MLLAPLAVTAAGIFSTPSHAQVGVVFGVPGIHVRIGDAPVYEPAPPPVYEPQPVVVEEPYWVWVPGVGYRYWDRVERDGWEHVHYARLYRRGYEPGWREHARYWSARPAYDRSRYERYEHGRYGRPGREHGRYERPRVEHERYDRGRVEHQRAAVEDRAPVSHGEPASHSHAGGATHAQPRGRPSGPGPHR